SPLDCQPLKGSGGNDERGELLKPKQNFLFSNERSMQRKIQAILFMELMVNCHIKSNARMVLNKF
ncbi:MAG: hypothetical protein QM523_10245, partial [Candidatus Pacebacteria bacterium]|nr:hypothetical protein [Candidatus Paceibacterota bacterium]